MLSCLHVLRQPDLLGMSVRVLLALVCGGLIGIAPASAGPPASAPISSSAWEPP